MVWWCVTFCVLAAFFISLLAIFLLGGFRTSQTGTEAFLYYLVTLWIQVNYPSKSVSSSVKQIIFGISTHLRVWGLFICVSVHVNRCIHLGGQVWRPEADVTMSSLGHFSTWFFWERVSHWICSLPCRLAWLASGPMGPCCSTPKFLGHTCILHLACKNWVLGI